jgi:hypothetical protein
MVQVYGYDISRVDIDFSLYLANQEAIDNMALKAGKHYFIGLEVIEDLGEVAVFLFPSGAAGNRPAINFADSVAEQYAVA